MEGTHFAVGKKDWADGETIFVESLVTGKFQKFAKNAKIDDPDQRGSSEESGNMLQSSKEIFDYEMLKAQHSWIGKTRKAYQFFHGVLAGMSLFHLIMVLSPASKTIFLNVYAPVCIIVPFIFIVISNLGLILSLSLMLLYKSERDERDKIKDR